MVVDTNGAGDSHHVCISVCVPMNFTCSYALGSALITVLWQGLHSQELMAVVRMNENPVSETRSESGFCLSLLSSELQKINPGRTGGLLHPDAPRQDLLKIN